jgi:hypothetical protein
MKKGLKMATRYEIAKNLLIKYKEASKKEILPFLGNSSLLKHQIPIRTFAEWNENRPGFIEIDLIKRFYFPILGIDSDKRNITFTRSRPYRKNDSAFVKQKNWSNV